MKTKQQTGRKNVVLATLSSIAILFFVSAFAQQNGGNQMADSRLFSFSEKFNNADAFVKEIKSGESNGSSELIFPASEGYKIMLEENDVHLQYFEKKFEEVASPVYEVSARNLNEMNYFKWMVKNDRKDGIFVVERSLDEENFTVVGFKNRVGSDIKAGLFYSWVDKKPLQEEVVFYRITALGEDGSYNFSETVKVMNPKYSIPKYF